MFSYSLYGLSVASDERLPSLREAPSAPGADIRIHVRTLPPASDFTSLEPWAPPGYAVRSGGVGYSIWRDARGELFRFRYPDGTEFTLDRYGANIWMRWREPLTLDDAVTYLIGPVIGFVLRWRGRLALHASCMATEQGAFSLTGPAGAGKSTTASAFARHGTAVLSDDITALEEHAGEFVAQPGYPRTCLWPAAAAALYGHADALPRITPTWDKRHVDLRQERGGFADSPAPLAAVYALARESDDDVSIRIEDLEPASAVVTLLANTYGNRLLDADMRAAEFAALDRLVRRVPVRRVVLPSALDRLAEVCERLLDDFQQLAGGSPRVA